MKIEIVITEDDGNIIKHMIHHPNRPIVSLNQGIAELSALAIRLLAEDIDKEKPLQHGTFQIWHPITKMNHNATKDFSDSGPYQKVAEVNAATFNSAYYQSQNDFNPEYAKLGIRSTSVGDILFDVATKQAVMVEGFGFADVDLNSFRIN